MFVDSHCHLDFPDLAAHEAEALAAMRDAGVSHALCVCVRLEDLPRLLALVERHDNLSASVGVHPDYEGVDEPDVERLTQLAAHPRVVAIGETGLDYFRQPGVPEWQQERFRVHIRAALASGKPLIVHTRAAAADTLRILREEGAHRVGGVMHCFTESAEVAQAALDLGFYISFSGIVTFRNAEALRDVVRMVPTDRLLIETDSPYLAPVPHRGKTNQPAWVVHVAQELARLRGEDVLQTGRITSENFFRLFAAARQTGRTDPAVTC